MNTPSLGTSPLHHRFEPPDLRLRAEPSAALHDFLVPNPRPDLTGRPEPVAPPVREERRRFFEPDSIFWSPEAHAGDAA